MGGEKLKLSLPCRGILLAAFLLALSFFCGPLFSQTPPSPPAVELQDELEQELYTDLLDPSLEGALDESAIILGEAAAPPAMDGGSSVFVILRMILVLALAALAIYGVIFFIKRLARPQESRDPHLKILARVPLTNDSFAAVLSVGAKAWLVAGGSGSVNLIAEIDETESLESMLLDDARKDSGPKPYFDFRSLLRRFARSPREVKKEQDGISPVEALRKQRERLTGL